MAERSWRNAPRPKHIALVASDMDGTLLTEADTVPEPFHRILDTMQQRGIEFVPASGNPYPTLARLFPPGRPNVSYIAENGALIIHRGQVLSRFDVDAPSVHHVIGLVRQSSPSDDVGLIICHPDTAYVERRDSAFVDEVKRYYGRLEIVDDLTSVAGGALKLSVYAPRTADLALDTIFASFRCTHQVSVSGDGWIDMTARGVDKGAALRTLQEALGITRAETVAFGDYPNDLAMLRTAEHSFAMANAHPTVLAAARYIAPANHEHGVAVVLQYLLGSPTSAPVN